MKNARFIIEDAPDHLSYNMVDLLTGEKSNYSHEWRAAKAAKKAMNECIKSGEPHMVSIITFGNKTTVKAIEEV